MKTIVWFGFVLGAVSAAGSVIYTTAQSKVTLNCGVKSFRRSLVWYHGGEMVVRIDGRSGIQRRGMTDVASRARAKQDTKLEISGVRQEDAGTFTCEVDGTNHEHTLAVVSVSASPTDEVELGTSVTLQCRVNGQSPGSTVQWMRPDGTTAAGTESGTVELRSVASSDAGTWKCVINPDGLTVDLKLKVKVLGAVIYTTAQSSVTLDCGVRSFSRSLVWYHEGEMVLSIDGRSGIQRRGETDIASRARVKWNTKLEISGVTQEDAGTFTCEADELKHEHTLTVAPATTPEPEPGVTTAAGTESKTVELQPVPSSDAGTWKFIINPGGAVINVKLAVEVLGAVSAAGPLIYTTPMSKVTLDCGVKSFRRSLVWYHEGEMVLSIDGWSGFQRRGMTDVASRARVKQDTQLEIFHVRQEDAGMFTCEADGTKHQQTLAVISGQPQF
ncbi:CD4-2 molecule, tandem duplicate 2 isoform X3 [Betta splendens]|uniref:CD4-2 molecule, tandem duplicate 2 isoform X3 n=1 Tax=Betta splendens TaxID=158456 RepID=A0A6P7KQT3_BETSP|nr:CD4-2 molecule, tandem duplicate 2 isoform X3 [Betta splendens]